MATLSSLLVTASGTVSKGTSSLIASKGLVVAAASEDATDAEKVEAADKTLATNRANCAGMDEVATSISTNLLASSSSVSLVCFDQFDDDCDKIAESTTTLITKLTALVQLSSADLEDSTIATSATEIITLIKSITIISYEQETTLISLVSTIKFTVFIYVSQISIVESKKLEISGALKFPGATVTIDEVDEKDFAKQETVLVAQLTNLFQISDANDKVLECITRVEGLSAAADPKPNAALDDDISKIPAMCGDSEPPVEEVQETAASVTKTCLTLTEQPTAAEMQILIIIKQSLITFKQTFVSQISVFSQKLSVVTGSPVTAASLGVKVISASGEIATATEVDITGGNEVGSQAYLVFRAEVFQSVLNSIILVLQKIETVLKLSSGTGDASAESSFVLAISSFSASLSSGAVTLDILEVAQTILKADITVLPSAAIILLLESATSSLQSLQLTIVNEGSVLLQLLIAFLDGKGISLSTITFNVKDFDATGSIIDATVSGTTFSLSASGFDSAADTILPAYENVELITSAALALDFSTISTAVTEVSATIFVNKLTSFVIGVSQGEIQTTISTIGVELLKLKVTGPLSAAITAKIEFLLVLVKQFILTLNTQLVLVQQSLTVDASSLSLTILNQIQEMYKQVILSISDAKISTSTTAATSSVTFFELCGDFFFLISSITMESFSVNLNLIITLGNKIVDAGNLGVSVSSQRFIIIYNIIIRSLQIVVDLVKVQITVISSSTVGETGGVTSGVTGGVTDGVTGGGTDGGTGGVTGGVTGGGSSPSVSETSSMVTGTPDMTMIMTTKMPPTMGHMSTKRPIPSGPHMMTTKNRPPLTTPNRRAKRFFNVVWNRIRGIRRML